MNYQLGIKSMKPDFNNRYLYAPINILTLFNLFTVLVFVFGPVQWKIDNEFTVVSYLLFSLSCLHYGYRKSVSNYKVKDISEIFTRNRKLIYFIIFFTFSWFIPLLYLRLGIASFSIVEIIEKVVEGLNNPLLVYNEKQQLFEENLGNESILQKLNTIFSPIIYSFFSYSILYFSKFSTPIKVGIITTFFLECLSWVCIGTNKGITDIALFLLFMGLALNPKMYRLNFKKIFVSIITICLILSFFINSMLSRFGISENSNLIDKIDFNVLGNPLKTTGIYQEMNIGIKFALMQITSYLCQGYYTIALALKEPFTWSYGFGNSWIGLRMWEKLTNNSLVPMTYMGSLERTHDINPNVAWYSIYTWLASDFTFWGVPVIMFLIGYALGTSWLDTIYKRTIYSSVVLCLFAQMIFYFFANNQILSFAFVPFIVSVFLWMRDR